VTFTAQFENAPVVLTSVMSSIDLTSVDSDPIDVTSTGFDARLQIEEARQGARAQELVGYIAFSTGGSVQSVSGVTASDETVTFGESFTRSVVVADTQTRAETDTQTLMLRSQSPNSARLFIAEEQSDDFEAFRIFGERIGFAAFDAGLLQGNRDGDASLVTEAELAAAAEATPTVETGTIGQAGSLTVSINSFNADDPIQVSYEQPLENAVITLIGEDEGTKRYTLRVVEQDANGFSFVVENWADAFSLSLFNTKIQWVAIEAGVHELADGRIIEAGHMEAAETSGSVSLNAGFTDAPVVITSTMSQNDPTPVDSDPLNVTASGFDVRLETSDIYNLQSRPTETVGYIAMSGGGDATTGVATTFDTLSGSYSWRAPSGFTDMIVVADTQTRNSTDKVDVKVDPSSFSTKFKLETTLSGGLPENETIGVLAFSSGSIIGTTLV
jgi:hypothetical protein